MIRVSCSAPRQTASKGLVEAIEALGLPPIVTNQVIRAVYEGDDHELGAKIVLMFEHETDHEITVDDDRFKKHKHH